MSNSMGHGLSKRLKACWDALIATEGKALGLEGCVPFLENKLVNDIFYKGTFNGIPCIVKCSSRAPESIENEYVMSQRLAAVAPVCAEALAKWRSQDGRLAFVVTRRLQGPSLTEVLAHGANQDEVADIVADMVTIAEALLKARIVWRDIITDNFIRDESGHFRLIDAQFAIDRDNFREDPFLQKDWGYRMLAFAHHPMMAGRGWNDAAMMLFCTWKLCTSPRAIELSERLRALTAASAFPVEYGACDDKRMRMALLLMKMRRFFTISQRRISALDTRIARAEAFLKRDCAIWEKVLYGQPTKGEHDV